MKTSISKAGVRVPSVAFAFAALVCLLIWLDAAGSASAQSSADRLSVLAGKLTDSTSFKVRLKAAVLLGRLNEPGAVQPLIRALRDDNYVVRGAAARALGNLGHPMAVEAVDPLFGLFADEVPFVQKEARRALMKLAGRESLAQFVAALDHHMVAVRMAAVSILAGMNLPEAQTAIIKALGDEDDEVQAEALVAVKGMGQPEMEGLLIQALQQKNNHRAQATAARLAGEMRMSAALSVLADLLVSDEVVPEVKSEASTALVAMKDQLDVPSLVAQLASEDTAQRSRAIKLLGLHGGREAVDALLGLLNHQDGYVRRRAVFALGDAGDPRAIKPLEYLMQTEENAQFKNLIQRTLRKLQP